MDYIPGGDLMSLLIKFGIFQEELAQWVQKYIFLRYLQNQNLLFGVVKNSFPIKNLSRQVLHLRAGLRCGQCAQDGLHSQGHQARQHSDRWPPLIFLFDNCSSRTNYIFFTPIILHRRQRPHQADGLWALHWIPVDSQQQILPEQRKDTQWYVFKVDGERKTL